MMNKRSKISLVLVIAVILVTLGVGLASARQIYNPFCFVLWQAMNKYGEPVTWIIPGEAEWDLDGSILTETCTGNIPLGEQIGKFDRYIFDLEDMRAYLYDTYGAVVGDPFVIGPDETGDSQIHRIDQGDPVTSYDWVLRVEENGDFERDAYFEVIP